MAEGLHFEVLRFVAQDLRVVVLGGRYFVRPEFVQVDVLVAPGFLPPRRRNQEEKLAIRTCLLWALHLSFL